MLEQKQTMDTLYNGVAPTMEKCGFAPVMPENHEKGQTPVYERDKSSVVDFSGEKGRLRLVFNENRIHLLSGENDIPLGDDSAFNLDATYLCVLEEYDDRDVKSLINEMNEQLEESYTKKEKIVSKKSVQTVSKTAARSGALAYDPVTLATKLSAMFPETKEEIKANIDTYGEFLCEDFFTTHVCGRVMDILKKNDPRDMKKLFNILGEIYEDGTNEVQSVITVTLLGPVKNDPTLVQNMMPYLSDTMLEPVLSVGKRLAKSNSANMRLANPPAYKPKKQKKSGGLMQQLMGGGGIPQQ